MRPSAWLLLAVASLALLSVCAVWVSATAVEVDDALQPRPRSLTLGARQTVMPSRPRSASALQAPRSSAYRVPRSAAERERMIRCCCADALGTLRASLRPVSPPCAPNECATYDPASLVAARRNVAYVVGSLQAPWRKAIAESEGGPAPRDSNTPSQAGGAQSRVSAQQVPISSTSRSRSNSINNQAPQQLSQRSPPREVSNGPPVVGRPIGSSGRIPPPVRSPPSRGTRRALLSTSETSAAASAEAESEVALEVAASAAASASTPFQNGFAWGGVISYKFDDTVPSNGGQSFWDLSNTVNSDQWKAKQAFIAAINALEAETCVRFLHDQQTATLVLKGSTRSMTNSFGNTATMVEIAMSPTWTVDTYKGIALHELGHALGLHHPMQRWDRDQFIGWHTEKRTPVCKQYYLGLCPLNTIRAWAGTYAEQWCTVVKPRTLKNNGGWRDRWFYEEIDYAAYKTASGIWRPDHIVSLSAGDVEKCLQGECVFFWHYQFEQKQGTAFDTMVEYDYLSVMHYPSTVCDPADQAQLAAYAVYMAALMPGVAQTLTAGGTAVDYVVRLSELDKEVLLQQYHSQCPVHSPSVEVEIEATAAHIGLWTIKRRVKAGTTVQQLRERLPHLLPGMQINGAPAVTGPKLESLGLHATQPVTGTGPLVDLTLHRTDAELGLLTGQTAFIPLGADGTPILRAGDRLAFTAPFSFTLSFPAHGTHTVATSAKLAFASFPARPSVRSLLDNVDTNFVGVVEPLLQPTPTHPVNLHGFVHDTQRQLELQLDATTLTASTVVTTGKAIPLARDNSPFVSEGATITVRGH